MTGLLLTVDPGLRACGVSCWDGEELQWARAVRGPTKGRGPAVWGALARDAGLVAPPLTGTLLIETMKVYSGSRTDPDDLLELNGVAGAVVGMLTWRGWVVLNKQHRCASVGFNALPRTTKENEDKDRDED